MAPDPTGQVTNVEVKEGYIWSYKITAPDRLSTKDDKYFIVTVSDAADQLQNPRDFYLRRNKRSEDVDQDNEKKFWAVSYSSVSMAIIATAKDALISKKKVRITYPLIMIIDRPGDPPKLASNFPIYGVEIVQG